MAAGLTYRPVRETVRGTLDWWATVDQERKDKPMRSGITAEREAELLAAWHAEPGHHVEIALAGDFNRDGLFNQLDIVAALKTGNYMQGSYAEEANSVD